MKEAIGGTWLFGIVITFIVFFTGYISMSTNYAKTFKVKDEILLTIEHFKGVNNNSIERINGYLKNVGYNSSGNCYGYDGTGTDSLGFYTKYLGFSTGGTSVVSTKNASYCISMSSFQSGDNNAGHPGAAVYKVVVFFTLDWPIVGSLINSRIEGETSIIHLYNNSGYKFD